MQLSTEIIMRKGWSLMAFIDLILQKKLTPVLPECAKLWLSEGGVN